MSFPRMPLALVLALWAFSSSGHAATEPAPIGLDTFGTSYAMVLNKSWKLVDSSDRREPKEVKIYHAADPDGAGAYDRQTDAYVWTGKCIRDEQTLVFKRTFWMPGPAKTFAAEFEATNSANPATRPIANFRLLINGQVVADVDGAQMTSIGITARYIIAETTNIFPQFIRYGENDIVVEVTKRKQSAAQNKCVEVTTPLGFRMHVYGIFEADLEVAKKVEAACYVEAGWKHCFEKIGQDQDKIVGQVYLATFRNRGPSAVYSATAFVDIIGSGASFSEMSTAEVPVEGCIWRLATTTNFQLDCDVTKVPKSWTAKVVLYFYVPLHFSAARLTVKTRYTGRTRDPVGENNFSNMTKTYCRPSATLERCKELYAAPVALKIDTNDPNYWLGPAR